MDYEKIARLSDASPQDVKHVLELWEVTSRRNRPDSDAGCVALVRLALAYANAVASPTGATCQRIEGPGDWRVYSRHVLDGHREAQRRILGLFGLGEPFATWAEARTFLAQMLRVGPKDGRPKSLYLEDANGMVGEFVVFDGVPEGADAAPDVPLHPLYELAVEAFRLGRELSVGPHKVTAWLLADRPFDLPWISGYLVDNRATGAISATLHVASVEAYPEEVATAYERIRGAQMWMVQEGPVTGRYKRARTTDRTAAMVAFVDSSKATTSRVESWPALADAFAVEHPEHKPYKSESMRVQYHREKERRQRAMKGGESQ